MGDRGLGFYSTYANFDRSGAKSLHRRRDWVCTFLSADTVEKEIHVLQLTLQNARLSGRELPLGASIAIEQEIAILKLNQGRDAEVASTQRDPEEEMVADTLIDDGPEDDWLDTVVDVSDHEVAEAGLISRFTLETGLPPAA